jgi:hypothetical protein
MIEFNTNQKLLPATDIDKQKSYTGDNYEQRTPKWVMKSSVYIKAFKGPKTVYDYLWRSIVRAPTTNDRYNVYENYYCRGQLACAPSIKTIAKNCNISEGSAKRYLNHLKDHELIQKFTTPSQYIPKSPKDKKYNDIKNIYVLGFITYDKIEDKDKEITFLEDLCRKSQ